MSKAKLSFFGAIGSGKTHTANVVKNMYPNSEVFSFARGLKDLAIQILDRPISKATDRLFLIHLGQGLRSDLIKFMGTGALIELLSKSLPVGSDSAIEDNRLQNVIFSFVEDNPDWGHANFWTDYLVRQIANSNADVFLVDDMRFQVEYDALLNIGFQMIKLECEDIIRHRRLIARDGKYDPSPESHPSELEWKNFEPHHILANWSIYSSDPLAPIDISNTLKGIVENNF